jgi:hypothetical protein
MKYCVKRYNFETASTLSRLHTVNSCSGYSYSVCYRTVVPNDVGLLLGIGRLFFVSLSFSFLERRKFYGGKYASTKIFLTIFEHDFESVTTGQHIHTRKARVILQLI